MEANLAVLIDFENIAAGTEKEGLGRFDVDAIMKRVKDKGRVLVARSYADWGRFARFKQSLLMANVTMYELTSHGMQDKNRADIAMVVDALELAFTRPHIDTFVVVSGDSDFTPLVLKMRELGKSVIGCGTRSSTSRLLIEACDEFFFYDSIAKDAKRRAVRPANTKKGYELSEAFDLVLDAIEGLMRENPEPPLASVVKTALLRKSPDFSETDHKFPSFARFLESAQEQGRVRLLRDEKSGGYRVDVAEGRPATLPPAAAAAKGGDEGGTWIDPYVPAGAEGFVKALAKENFNPLAAPTRKAILDLLEQMVADRKTHKRRINAQFVQEDVRKRLRKTHPDVPAKPLRDVFNALLRAGVLMHRDGTPVRTGLAPFDLNKSSEEINKALTNVYLDILFEAGFDLSNSALLAELFLGDPERAREIEEVVAWLQAADVDEAANGGDDKGEEPEELEMGLDDLLSVESTEEIALPPSDEEAAEAEEAPGAEAGGADEAEEAPRKRSRGGRGRGGKKKDEAKAAPAEEPAGDDESRKTTRKRKPKKDAADDLDAFLEADE